MELSAGIPVFNEVESSAPLIDEICGRLQRALVQLDAGSALAWATQHPDELLVVMRRKLPEQYPKAVFTQPCHSGYLAVWNGRTVIENPAVLP